MRLFYLSEIGGHYTGEVDTSGVRIPVLEGVAASYRQALLDLRTLGNAGRVHRPLPPPPGESSVARARRLQQEAITAQSLSSLSPKDKFELSLKQDARAKLQARVDNLRLKLIRQGAVLRPDGSIDWTVSDRVVVYDTDAALRDLTRLRLHGGRMYTDDAHTKPFDTTAMVTQFSGPGKAIYVMSKSGALHASSHSVGHRHHSSLLAGKPVAGGGELEVKAGVLKWISNKSGHYRPNITHFLPTLHTLEKAGITNGFNITFFAHDGSRHNSGNIFEFQRNLIGDDKDHGDFELNKLLLYSRYLDDAILATHAPNPWRLRASASEAMGVYDATTHAPIPHRDVRKWFKANGMQPVKDKQSGYGR